MAPGTDACIFQEQFTGKNDERVARRQFESAQRLDPVRTDHHHQILIVTDGPG